MLHIHHSNRLEILADALAGLVAGPLADPFAAEPVVVQNPGMARWINQRIAERNGISARLEFPLPAGFFWQVLKAWLPDAPDLELYSKDALMWRIMALLPEHLGDDAFAPLRHYLAGEKSDLRLLQLAGRIADLFDQYLVLRPDMVIGWESGQDVQWQAILWRALCGQDGHAHRARLLQELERAIGRGGAPAGELPGRVSLFGLTALPPVYLRLLGALGRFVPVHCFCLNPSREYWADIVDERGQARRRAKAARAGLADPTGLLDLGNPLLASFGHAGQVFLDQLLELGGEDLDRFEPPGDERLLHRVQSEILDLVDARDAPRPCAAGDGSIQVHSVHGPLREVQVLHDRLLRLFEDLDGLEPRDIVVMAPDIDEYAPYIDAVFGAADPALRIPWSVADRRVGAEQPVVAALRQLLALPRSRFEASEVLSVLEVPAVGRRFGLDAAGIERIRTWVGESGVRWGEDEAMAESLGLPGERANTWAFGLDRLFLGLAMPPDPHADPWLGVLPYPDLEGGELAWLGALESFMEALGAWRRRLGETRAPTHWRTALNALIADFFDPDIDEEPVLQAVRAHLDTLVSLSERTGFAGVLSLDQLRALLDGLLDESRGAQRFLTGGVTFCNMVPMRSIPFRVVCLIGMNNEAFPRGQHPPSFDLMAQAPRRGDRSRRRDDRYLFLEALLSARDCLYLSWVGRDERDDSIKVASVVLGELLDYLRRGHGWRDEQIVQHPLQPFARAYFDASTPRLFSYSRVWADAARSERGGSIPAFAGAPLGAPDEQARTLEVDALIRFLRNPSRYFLTRRLGLRLPDEAEVPEDTEPFDAAGLERYALRQSMLRRRLAGRESGAILASLRGEGRLPQGAPGELVFEEQLESVDPFCARLVPLLDETPVEPPEVDIRLGGFRLQGRLDGLRGSGLLGYRLGSLRCRDWLGIWVRHLVLNAIAPADIARESRFVAEDCTLTLAPVPDAEDRLADLLELRWQGLQEPLAFHPESALAWLQRGDYGSAFHKVWDDEHAPAPESGDPAVRIAFRGRDPLGPAFEANAIRILAPMLEHSDVVKADESKREAH